MYVYLANYILVSHVTSYIACHVTNHTHVTLFQWHVMPIILNTNGTAHQWTFCTCIISLFRFSRCVGNMPILRHSQRSRKELFILVTDRWIFTSSEFSLSWCYVVICFINVNYVYSIINTQFLARIEQLCVMTGGTSQCRKPMCHLFLHILPLQFDVWRLDGIALWEQ